MAHSDKPTMRSDTHASTAKPPPLEPGELSSKHIYIIWSGTSRGQHQVLGFARDLFDALKAMDKLTPANSAANDEVRANWPRDGVTEILRTWADGPKASRWLRATPTFHALDSGGLPAGVTPAHP